jgi:hypothetical protein
VAHFADRSTRCEGAIADSPQLARTRKISGLSRRSLSTRRSLVQRLVGDSGLKIQFFRKIFGNFVPNFREQMANDKHYPKGKTRNQNENTYETKP